MDKVPKERKRKKRKYDLHWVEHSRGLGAAHENSPNDSSILTMSNRKRQGNQQFKARILASPKSHMCVHTYPEMHRDNGISTFRADIELATCGEISPLTALNYLL